MMYAVCCMYCSERQQYIKTNLSSTIGRRVQFKARKPSTHQLQKHSYLVWGSGSGLQDLLVDVPASISGY